MKELIEAYKKVRPNVTINPRDHVLWATSQQKVAVGFATRHGPAHPRPGRLVLTSSTTTRASSSRSTSAPSASRATTNCSPATRRADLPRGTFGGKVYALPYQGNSMSLFISNKAFREAGLDPGQGRAEDLGRHEGARAEAEEGAGQPAPSRKPSTIPTTARAGKCRCSSRSSSSSAASFSATTASPLRSTVPRR